MISTQIDINRTPEQVRAVFLDFAKFPEWHHDFIKSIAPADPGKPTLDVGDKLNVVLVDMNFVPVVLETSPREFKWRGRMWGLPGLFTGEHSFKFEPCAAAPGTTTLVQSETFSGVLSFLVAPSTNLGKQIHSRFDGLNSDIKARAESL